MSCPEKPLGILYYYLTEGCNLLCRHCWLAPRLDRTGGERPVLDPDIVRSTLSQALALGLTSVKLTGGEPLLHPRIGEILGMVRDAGVRLMVETNGTRCTEELAAAIGSAPDSFASVSLDGADAETHEFVRGVPGCFEAALDGIRRLVAAGVRTQVIMTVMRRNSDQLERMIRLGESLGVHSVKFNVVQPASRGVNMHRDGEVPDVGELIELGRDVEGRLSATTPLKLHFSFPMAFRSLKHMFGDDGIGCTACGMKRILGVLPDGSYALCGVGRLVPELVFGHASRDPLASVWNDHEVLEDLRRGLPDRLEGVCGRCLVRSRCLGGCIAQNYYSTRSLWAPYWFCQQAEEEGLFPVSRLAPPRGGDPVHHQGKEDRVNAAIQRSDAC